MRDAGQQGGWPLGAIALPCSFLLQPFPTLKRQGDPQTVLQPRTLLPLPPPRLTSLSQGLSMLLGNLKPFLSPLERQIWRDKCRDQQAPLLCIGFNRISNPLVDDLSDIILMHLLTTKTEKRLLCCKYEISGVKMSSSTFVVDEQSAARLLRVPLRAYQQEPVESH